MIIKNRWVAPLRVFLALLFGILVVFQTLSLPGQFRFMAEQSPDLAYLRWPLTAASVFWLLCIQVVIVCVWKLLTLVANDRIFTTESMVWVNATVGSIVAAWVVLAGAFFYVVPRSDDPALPFLIVLVLVGVAVVGLLMVVMRSLLEQATSLRTDMEAVI